MLQKTYTKAEIDQFYKDVEAAGVKKLGAKLTKLTGLSSGNVSEYLSRKKEASDKLINVFYEHYGSSIKTPNQKEDYLSGKNLENFSEAQKLLASIVHAQSGSHQDRVLAPIVDLIQEIAGGKKQMPIDELIAQLRKALVRDNGYR